MEKIKCWKVENKRFVEYPSNREDAVERRRTDRRLRYGRIKPVRQTVPAEDPVFMYPQFINGGIQPKTWKPTTKRDVKKYDENLVCRCGRVADFDGEYCKLCIKSLSGKKNGNKS